MRTLPKQMTVMVVDDSSTASELAWTKIVSFLMRRVMKRFRLCHETKLVPVWRAIAM